MMCSLQNVLVGSVGCVLASVFFISMLLESAAVAAQGSHRGWWDWGVLDAAGDGWNVCVVVRQTVNCFASCVRSSDNDDIAVERKIVVPWNDCVAVVELGLWSMLSTAAVVKTSPLIVGGQTTCS